MRESTETEAPGVWLRYHESKTHQGIQEEYVPEELAPLIRDAVMIAETVTQELADYSKLDFLFLTESSYGTNRNYSIRNISSEAFCLWLNGRHDQDGNVSREGFIHRYNIRYHDFYYTFTPHQTRHTQATQLYLGGAGFGTVNEKLHHRSLQMTGVYTHGKERDLQELVTAMNSNTVIGKAAPLLENREVFIGEISKEDLEYYKANGMYIQTTEYGFCTRPSKRGPCPYPHECWRGHKGDLCEYTMLLPRGLKQMEEDVKVMDMQTELWEKASPDSPFLSNVRATKTYYEELKTRLEGGNCSGCGNHQQPNVQQETQKTKVNSPVNKRHPSKNRRKAVHQGGFLTQKEQSVADQDEYLKRINELYESVKKEMKPLTLVEFARQANTSVRQFKAQTPDVVRKLNDLQKEVEYKAIINRMEKEWEKVVASDEAPTIVEFAKRCGLTRHAVYKIGDTVGITDRIKERMEKAHQMKAKRRMEQRAENSRKLQEERKKERRQRIEEKASMILSQLQQTNQFLSTRNFARELEIGEHTLQSEYPKWLERLNKWNKGVRESQVYELEQILEQEWTKIEQIGEKVSLKEFADRCGVDRNTIYDLYPEWAKRVKSLTDYKEVIERAFAEMLASGKRVTVSGLCKRCGIHRNVLSARYPEYVERINVLKT